MRLKADENIPARVIDLLRRHDYDVSTVVDQDMVGAHDRVLAEAAASEDRILISLESWAAVPRLSGRLRLDRRAANSQRPRFYDDVAAKEVLEGVFA